MSNAMDMASSPDARAGRAVTFGPFRLVAAERLLERDARRIVLGSRALDVLIHLVANAGQTVNKKTLIANVWAGVEISESVLRVHVATLRKVLSDGNSETRYITNVAGQGYCFVAPVVPEHGTAAAWVARPATPARQAWRLRLPPVLVNVIGREQVIDVVRTRLLAQRFVTIVAPGGSGKTTVAVSVAQAMGCDLEDGAVFADLGALTEPGGIAGALADAFGLPADAGRETVTVLALLERKQALLVLDNCEHLIETVAPLAEQIFRQAPSIRILATSREALRVDGETVYRLPSLQMPVDFETMSAADLCKLPAVALFIDRSNANGAETELADAHAVTVARLCKRLDGLALAIEIAGGFAGEFGVDAAAELVQDTWRLLRQPGRRTAPPRQLSLGALFDWSHALLTDYDRLVFRRIAVFPGRFDHASAHAVVEARGMSEHVMTALRRLVTASLLSTAVDEGGSICHYLPETCRAFALEKLDECGDRALATERYALHCALNCDGRQARLRPAALAESGPTRHTAQSKVLVPTEGEVGSGRAEQSTPGDRT